MASIVNFSNFTFTAEQIRDINELVFDELLHAPELGFIHTLFSGIVYDKEIGFISGSVLSERKDKAVLLRLRTGTSTLAKFFGSRKSGKSSLTNALRTSRTLRLSMLSTKALALTI